MHNHHHHIRIDVRYRTITDSSRLEINVHEDLIFPIPHSLVFHVVTFTSFFSAHILHTCLGFCGAGVYRLSSYCTHKLPTLTIHMSLSPPFSLFSRVAYLSYGPAYPSDTRTSEEHHEASSSHHLRTCGMAGPRPFLSILVIPDSISQPELRGYLANDPDRPCLATRQGKIGDLIPCTACSRQMHFPKLSQLSNLLATLLRRTAKPGRIQEANTKADDWSTFPPASYGLEIAADNSFLRRPGRSFSQPSASTRKGRQSQLAGSTCGFCSWGGPRNPTVDHSN